MSTKGAFARLTAPVGPTLRAAVGLQAVSAVLVVGVAVGIWWVVRAGLEGGSRSVWVGVGVTAVGAVGGYLLRVLAYRLSHRADLRVAAGLRARIAGHLERLPLGWFGQGAAERALDAFGNDVGELHTAIAHGRLERVAALVTPGAVLVWFLLVDWRMTLVAVAPVALYLVLFRRSLRQKNDGMRDLMAGMIALTTAIGELVRDMPTLRTLRGSRRGRPLAERAEAGSDQLVTAMADTLNTQTRSGLRNLMLVDPVTLLTVTLLGGVAFVAAGWTDPLDVLPFLLAGPTLAAPIQHHLVAHASVQAAYRAAGRVEALLATPPIAWAEPGTAPRHTGITLDGVSFGHTPERTVLSEVDLDVEPGSFTAVVGHTGSGKSTLVGLLARFHDPTAGAVRIGGVDLRELDAATLNRSVAIMLQDTTLLRMSLRDNIRLARPSATDDEVVAAARTALIHDRIMRLPRGYDAVAGEQALLSGGERQRVALARVILAGTPILLLDEATAQVDPASEAAIGAGLAELRGFRTIVTVAHRLSTVVDADRIVVLDDGRVVEQGTHAELLSAGGHYARLWRAWEDDPTLAGSTT